MAVQIQAYFIGVGGNILEAIVSICSTSKSIVLSDSEFISEIVASRNERLHLLLVDMKLSSGRVERIGTTAAGQGLRIESLGATAGHAIVDFDAVLWHNPLCDGSMYEGCDMTSWYGTGRRGAAASARFSMSSMWHACFRNNYSNHGTHRKLYLVCSHSR